MSQYIHPITCDSCDDGYYPNEGDFTGLHRCYECREIRELHPVLFDYLIRVMDKRIDSVIQRHEDKYEHARYGNYD